MVGIFETSRSLHKRHAFDGKTFANYDEAIAYIGENRIVYHEKDEDHPGCGDVFMKNGILFAIEVI